MIADILTKAVARPLFVELLSLLDTYAATGRAVAGEQIVQPCARAALVRCRPRAALISNDLTCQPCEEPARCRCRHLTENGRDATCNNIYTPDATGLCQLCRESAPNGRCNCPCDGCNPLQPAHVWHMSHREWNRIQHALHGNGCCPHCGELLPDAIVFSEDNLEVIDDDEKGSHELICHQCQGVSAYPLFHVEGNFYFVEDWGWHVQLDYIHDDGIMGDVMMPSGSERTVALRRLVPPRFSAEIDQQQFLQLVSQQDGFIFSHLTPCCFGLWSRCGSCYGAECTLCGNSRMRATFEPPFYCVDRDGRVSDFACFLCSCSIDVA